MDADLPKQYLDLGDRTVIEHTLERIASVPGLRGVVVGISENDTWWSAQRLPAGMPIRKCHGGMQRAHTVRNGLLALQEQWGAGERDLVLVHDAVRPLVSAVDIVRVIEVAREWEDGAILGCPIVDTLKRADDSGLVSETMSRDGLWRAMTPQVFTIGRIRSALDDTIKAGLDVTDECEAMERTGARPSLVASDPRNIKITRPPDLELARSFLAAGLR